MDTQPRENFTTYRDWFNSVIDENIILRGTSALEYLQRFVGYRHETEIFAYAIAKGKYDNVDYRIVDTFDDIEYETIYNIKCTTFSQTVNDMLADFENTDEMALTEALSDYYVEHNQSFDGLIIKQNNMIAFESIRENVINCASGR